MVNVFDCNDTLISSPLLSMSFTLYKSSISYVPSKNSFLDTISMLFFQFLLNTFHFPILRPVSWSSNAAIGSKQVLSSLKTTRFE